MFIPLGGVVINVKVAIGVEGGPLFVRFDKKNFRYDNVSKYGISCDYETQRVTSKLSFHA